MRSRYIQSTRTSCASSMSARATVWPGSSTTISLAPRDEIRSNIPTPSRTSSSSMLK
jgi:hypothetical protein